MPVPSITVLKFLSSARNSSDWPSLKVDMLRLYVSDMACEGFLHILTLIMWFMCSSYNFTLMRGIGGGSIQSCISALIHGPFFMADILVYLDGVAYVSCSDFAKCRTR